MSTSEKIREVLATKGITNGRMLADHMRSKGVIFFVRGQGGWISAKAELRYTDEDGHRQRKVFRPKGEAAVRDQCVEDAMTEARKRLGVDSWSKSPFSGCWLPSDDVSKVHEQFENRA